MGSLETEGPAPAYGNSKEEEESPIEEVRLTVTNTDDPSLPVWTFRMWFLGVVSCAMLSFLNQFFAYRTEPLVITQITVQVASLPIGHFLASVLPKATFRLPGFGSNRFSLNPGPFNIKEHVLISIFANAGCAFGSGSAYAVGIVTIVKAFYGRNISFLAGWLLIITTQVLGYGWAGLLRKYVIEPAHMWWPGTLVQVSLFRALHEKDEERMSRAKFFLIVLICSFSWYLFPGYLFTTLTSISWMCWTFSKSVTAQQIGSGMRGLGLGAVTLDWTAIASFLGSPLVSPFFAIMNVFAGYALIIYIVLPTAYWGFNLYGATKFPIFSSHLFTAQGQKYNISAIVNDKFELDIQKYEQQGRIHLSMFFSLTYGFGFATIAATLTHVACFYGREISERFRASYNKKEDIHTRLMRKYSDIPSWWFYILLAATFTASLMLCIFLNDQVQMPWWALVFACIIAFVFTLPISIITATTNQTPGLNIITEYVMGLIYPGRPIANVCFKVYGYMSMAQAVSFLSDFKLGHYMKIPPRSMFIVQSVGTIIAGTINISVAWWLLTSIKNICQDDLLPPDSPWTCPGDRVFFDASVIWGLVGPKRIFGSLGNYSSMNWFFLGGALGPIIVWLFHKAFPKQSWIPLINLPVLLGATGMMPPATPVNYNAWIIFGTIFNYFVFHYRKSWWQRYNYIVSAALDAGRTGLRDDDLRETAYEVFLACMLFSGLEIHSTEGRKREKSSKFLSGLKNRKDKRHIESAPIESHLKVLDTIRLQMQISEAADAFIRRRLTQFVMGKACAQIDVPQLSLVLLTGLLRSDFPSEKSYLHWKSRQANIFEELVRSDHKKTEKEMIEESLAKIRNHKEWDMKMSSSQRSDVLLTLRQVALAFSSIPGRFGVEGETYYWTSGYHLNIRLYEKLLFGLFDVLEESQIIEEAEEILKLVKLTWSMLGITERLHHTLFAWVLFQQFVTTEEAILLDHAIHEVEHVLSAEVNDDKEVAYMRSLTCPAVRTECETRSDLLQSIFLSISLWCDSKLQDYHLYFSQKPTFFERVLTMGLSTGTRDFIPHGNIQFTGYFLPDEVVTQKIRVYVEKTLYTACRRVIDVTIGSTKGKMHPLAILASELKQIAEKDVSIFSPVLRRWYPECAMVPVKMLHQFYGEKLKPFMKDITSVTEDVRRVLPAAYELECCLIEFYSSAFKDNNLNYSREFERYPIAEISKSFILDWVVAQHERILEWTGRAFDLEDWEPLSAQQKHAASAVEVFRIIEETVDQFFEWSLPMDITHLQALLSIIFHSLDTYLSKVISQLVEKQKLYPSPPPLTRYKEATFPIVKRKVVESSIADHEIYKQLDELTSSKLCIRLNTYRYIQKQIAILEEGIRKSWGSVTSYRIDRYSTERTHATLEPTDVNGESVSELFVATLDCIRDSAAQGIRKTSDFLGAKIVFWDMRDSFLSYLYYGGVEGNRLDAILPQFDKVLNDVCSVIDDTIRDLVVSSIWKASLEGFMWVLLDGGPSRAFSDSDTVLIEEDFNMLKELFIADGEGLPRSLVEEEAKFYRQVLGFFSLQTQSLIKMLMASSQHISAGGNTYKQGQRYRGDTHTLIRVLCHKKDREASKFLKRHYRFPASSEYDETASESSSFGSPFVADMLKRGASLRWSEKGHSSFKSITKKFQEVTWK